MHPRFRQFLLTALCLMLVTVAYVRQLLPTLAQGGSCAGCYTVWTTDPVSNKPCQIMICTGVPDALLCFDKKAGSQVCNPSDSIQSNGCGAEGVNQCSYSCNATGTGWDAPTCNRVGNTGNFVREFCNYAAGCPNGADGVINGKRTRIALLCTQNGMAQSTTEDACGSCQTIGRCVESRDVICPHTTPTPGPTPTPGKPPTSQPTPLPQCPVGSCQVSGCGWSCAWNGVGLANGAAPVPQVNRLPYPRGLVSVPNKFTITSQCAGPTGGPSGVSRSEKEAPFLKCAGAPEGIYGYRVSWSWMCGAPGAPGDMGASWTMDERPWNVGHTNEGGETIQNQMGGMSIQHTYETSSYGKPETGPSHQPAYQVQLTTQWTMAANFQRLVLTTETGCWDANGNGISPCPSPDQCNDPNRTPPVGYDPCAAVATREKKSLNWVSDVSYAYRDTVPGAMTNEQDPNNPGGCGVPMSVPVLKMDTVLGP